MKNQENLIAIEGSTFYGRPSRGMRPFPMGGQGLPFVNPWSPRYFPRLQYS